MATQPYPNGTLVRIKERTLPPSKYRAYYAGSLVKYAGLITTIITSYNDIAGQWFFYDLDGVPGSWSDDMFEVIDGKIDYDPTKII
jgi:hypothetical protein